MLTFEQVLRRSAAITLGLVAMTGVAAAQGAMGGDTYGGATTAPPAQTEPQPQPMGGDTYGTTAAPVAEPQPAPTYTDTGEYEEPESMLQQYGIAVALGGGVEGFTSDTMTTATDVGGAWNVRVSVGTRSPIAFEGAYIGSAQSIDALGLDTDSLLIGNGLDGKLRVNFLDYDIQPFAFAGVGWRHYNLAQDDFNTSAINDSDDVLEVPMGLGLAGTYEGFMGDLRGEFRYASGADMVPSLDINNIGGAASMHRWAVNANIGYNF